MKGLGEGGSRTFRILVGLAAVACAACPQAVAATAAAPTNIAAPGEVPVGKVSGLPVPRYVSLKTDRVNLREGPSKDNRTAWVFQRAGLPVEITAEYETWRRIRDAEGTEGWVLHSLLSGRRTALVMPWSKNAQVPLPLRDQPDEKAGVVVQLQPNVIASVKSCRDRWCRIVIVTAGSPDVGGYMRQDNLWGVYPDEKVE